MNERTTAATRQVLDGLSEKVFCAGYDGAAPGRLTLHVSKVRSRRALEKEARAALAAAGLGASCRIEAFDDRRLARASSVEALVRAFSHDGLVYDPTRAVSRAGGLLRLAGRVRASLGGSVRGLYWDPASRTAYVLCREAALSSDGKPELETAKSAAADWRRTDGASFELKLRLCVELPKIALLPVDEASRAELPRASWLTRLKVIGGLAALLSLVLPDPARSEGPAVSQINGKAAVEGGLLSKDGSGIGQASLTLPVGRSFGAQFDTAGGRTQDKNFWGLAGQLFWRDPEKGLLGGFWAHTSRDIEGGEIESDRYGGQAQYYKDGVTVSGVVGGQGGDAKDGVYGILDVAWYPSENLKFHVGGDVNPGTTLGLVGVEYQLGVQALAAVSVFADAGLSGHSKNEDGFAIAGFRYYFGPSKTLIKRHREDDPPAFASAGGTGAESSATTTSNTDFGHY